jgi:hypothetical protein|tara:strand:+ start:7592 stop:7930 length:339 start_codon:yes stop_codon:yes gene_type:complete
MAIFVSNLTIEQGFDFEAVFELENISTTEPLNLSNYSNPIAQLRKSYSSSNKTSFNISILDETAGKIFISLPATTTVNLKEGRYVYDIRLTAGTSIVKVVEGSAIVRGGVTR